MYIQECRDRTVYLRRKDCSLSNVPSNVFHNADFVIVHAAVNYNSIFQTTQFSDPSAPIRFYYNDDGNLYLTDYDIDQNLLSIPIDVIAVSEDKVYVYIGQVILEIEPNSVTENCKLLSFYTKNRLCDNSLIGGPSRKRMRYYRENRAATTSEASVEHGIFTEFSMSLSSESTSDHRSIIEQLSDETSVRSDNATIRRTMPIQTSKIDLVTRKRIKLSDIKSKLIRLLSDTGFIATDKMVSPEQLTVTKEFGTSDTSISNMENEIQRTFALEDSDPITVARTGSSMTVLSGNRRVQAFKNVGINQIRVKIVDGENAETYRLFRFFSDHFKDRVEPGVKDFIIYIQAVFSFLGLKCEEIRSWTVQEIREVFGVCIEQNEKYYGLLDVCVQSDLSQRVLQMEFNGIPPTLTLVMDILRKYKKNPSKTLEVLSENYLCPKRLKSAINDINPDSKHMLENKGVPANEIDELMAKFGEDARFPKFVNGLDVRANRKTLSIASITKHFEQFKKRNPLPQVAPKAFPNVCVTTDVSGFSNLVTDKKELMESFLDSNDDCLVLLIGSSESSCNFSFLLNDKSGILDEDGVIHNHCSISLWLRMEKKLIRGHQLTTVLAGLGCVRKTIMQGEDLRKLVNGKRVYLETDVDSNLNVASSFLMDASLIGVPCSRIQSLFSKLLK